MSYGKGSAEKHFRIPHKDGRSRRLVRNSIRQKDARQINRQEEEDEDDHEDERR